MTVRSAGASCAASGPAITTARAAVAASRRNPGWRRFMARLLVAGARGAWRRTEVARLIRPGTGNEITKLSQKFLPLAGTRRGADFALIYREPREDFDEQASAAGRAAGRAGRHAGSGPGRAGLLCLR